MNLDYKAVIFDFNGTLFFDAKKHELAWSKVSNELRGKPITMEEMTNHIHGVPNVEAIGYLLDEDIDEAKTQYYSKQKEAYYREYCLEDKENFHLVEGAITYFDYLKEKNVPFTIASASIKENIDFFVESFHLDKYIDPKTIIYDDGSYEDKVQMFKDAASILNCEMEDVLVFEDSMSGIKNAYEAGCTKIIVIDPQKEKKKFLSLPGVIQVISDFSEI